MKKIMDKIMDKINSDMIARTILNLMPLFIIPFICFFVLYISSCQMLMKREQHAMQKVVSDCEEKLENAMDDARAVVSYISNNPQILQYLYHYNPEDTSSIIKMMDAQEILESLILTADKISLVQIYANGSETLIDQTTCAKYLDRYYREFFIEGMEYEEWRDFVMQSTKSYELLYNMEFMYYGIKHDAWVMSYRIPQRSSAPHHGQLFLYFDKNKLLEDFSSLDYHYGGGYLTVIDTNGEILLMDNVSEMSEGDIQEDVMGIKELDSISILPYGRKDMLAIKSYSAELDAYVVMAVSMDYAYGSVRSIRTILEAMFFLLVAGSIVLMMRVARKLTHPFMEMHSLLNTEKATQEELFAELINLMEHNKSLKNEVMSNMPALKTAAMYNLLLGGFESSQDMEKGLSMIGIDREARQYGLLIIRLCGMKDKSDLKKIWMLQALVGKAVEHDISEVQGVYFPDYERILVLCVLNEEGKNEAERHLERCLEKLIYPFFKEKQLEVLISGDVATKITDFPGMFMRAQSVLDCHAAETMNLKVHWYSQEKKKYLKYNYPPEMEIQLGSTMVMGNAKRLVDVFENLKQANARLFENHLDMEICKLLEAIYQTLYKKQKEYRIHDVEQLEQKKTVILENIQKKENLVQTFYLLEEAFYICMNPYVDAWKEQKNDLAARIHVYIRSNYRDPQICLSSIAETFSITESYLSRLYKQSFGVTCNKAIQSLRMEDAIMQLSQGKSVSQVAEYVGYNSVHVFRRVYKKYYQEIPSRWRELPDSDC